MKSFLSNVTCTLLQTRVSYVTCELQATALTELDDYFGRYHIMSERGRYRDSRRDSPPATAVPVEGPYTGSAAMNGKLSHTHCVVPSMSKERYAR